MLNDYIDGNCNLLAIGYEDTSLDKVFLERLCENNLVYTSSVIVEAAIAFPIRRDLASGFSYWIQEGKRNGADLQTAKEKFNQNLSCDVHFSKEAESEGVSLSISFVVNFWDCHLNKVHSAS